MPRVAIVRGLRTPFAKSGTSYARLSALDLGKMAVAELIERSGIDPATVQEVVFGNVIPSVKAPNIAREIVLGTGLPRKIPGYTIGKACASANQAIASASDLISRGYADTVIAGGAESLSDIPILFSKNFSDALVGASKQKSVGGKLGAFRKIRPKDLAPDAPAILRAGRRPAGACDDAVDCRLRICGARPVAVGGARVTGPLERMLPCLLPVSRRR